jgi:ligand-binding sensor protein
LRNIGGCAICTKFHRAFPESAKHHKKSNVYLTEQLKKLKEINIKPCENGLVDGTTPIVIKGKHLARLFTGQILFEVPDMARFKKPSKSLWL